MHRWIAMPSLSFMAGVLTGNIAHTSLRWRNKACIKTLWFSFLCVCACAPALRPQAGEGTLNQNLARPTGTSPLLPASFEGHSRWPLAGGGQGRNSWRGINLFFATAPHKPIRADPTGALVLGEENTRRVNLGMLILAGTFQLPAG